jgi:uncharacterized protein (TIGR03067 family)
MYRLTSAMCGLILGFALVLGSVPRTEAAETKLQGNWTATKAERDGKPAAEIVGHRLSFTGDRFEIKDKDGKLVYGGTVRVDPQTKPATIDFESTEGALKGMWKGIYTLAGDTLTICDNAPNTEKPRPPAFEAKAGSGYVLVAFRRAKP